MDLTQVVSYMKSKDFILCLHTLFSLSSLVGISIWASSDDVYTLTSSYNFYWFLCILTLLVSGLSVVYYKFPNSWEYVTSNMDVGLTQDQKMYFMSGLSFILTIMWLAAAASVADVTKECLHFKKYWQSAFPDEDYPFYDRFSNGYYDLTYNYKCHGEIVSTTFGFLLFSVWLAVSYLLSQKLYSKLKEPTVIDVANHSHQLQTTSDNTVSNTV